MKRGNDGVGVKDKLWANASLTGVTGVAAVAFALLTAADVRAVGLIAAALALAGIVWLGRSAADLTVPAEVLVAAGLIVDIHGTKPSSTVALTLGGGILVALVACQPILTFLVDRGEIEVANLPGFRPERSVLVPPSVLARANPFLILIVGVFAVAKLPVWPMTAIVVAAAAVAGFVGLQALRLRLRGGRNSHRLRAALERYEPVFALHFSAPDNTEYHVDMWRPYLERIGLPWIIITREPEPFRMLSASAGVPVLYCPYIDHVDEVVTPGLKTVFYVNNGMKNSHMVRLNHLTHIQLLHGDSDKSSSFNPVTAMFDRIFVAGQAGIDRYAANGVLIPREKFDIVGRPQVETIRVIDEHIATVTDQVVLYATTWVSHYEHANYSSLRIGEKIIEKLLERKATVVLRPHPYTDRDPGSARRIARLHQMLADDRERTGRQHVFGPAAAAMTVFECTNRVDAMVSDISGIASDFLYSGKPFALTNMLGDAPDAFEASFPLARAAYVVDSDTANLDHVLDQLLDSDPLEKTRREVKTYYLGDFDAADYADGFVSAARRYL
jgi:hypothetical protein